MKANIHPQVFETPVTCASCGKTWVTTSTKKELRVDVCSNCHPFFTGEAAKLLDVEGQVDRFYKKLSARQEYVEQQKEKEEELNSPRRSIDDLGLTPRATNALKNVGILTIGQLLDKFSEGEPVLLAIPGFGQSAVTSSKKKLRALGFDLPEAPKVEKAEKAEKAEQAEKPAEAEEASE